jgi:hypothetical protein
LGRGGPIFGRLGKGALSRTRQRKERVVRQDAAAEVAEIVSRFIHGAGDAWEWDDFLCVRQADPFLDAIRLECGELQDRFPAAPGEGFCSPDGLARLRELLALLGERAARSDGSSNG